MERPTVGALAAAPSSKSEPDEGSQPGITGEDKVQSPGAAESIRARAKLAKVHFENGLRYRRGGDSGRALVDFLKATREDPKLVEAYYEQALIFREKGFHKLAVSRLEQALAIKGQYQKARLLLATIKLEQGNVSDAVEQLGASLGLPKSSTTALKPDVQADHKSDLPGVPPIILQSLHTAMPQPQKSNPLHAHESGEAKVGNSLELSDESRTTALAKSFDQDEEPTFADNTPTTSSPAQKQDIRRKKPGSRRKVRELMARKYRKNTKKQQRNNWIAKLFSWPEPFKFKPASETTEKIAADEPRDSELQPRAASNLVAEFQAEDKAETTTSESKEEYTPHFPNTKRTLLAYNGDPVDTIDLVRENISDRNESKKAKSETKGASERGGLDPTSSTSKHRSPSAVHFEADDSSSSKNQSPWPLEKISSSSQKSVEAHSEATTTAPRSTATKADIQPRKTRSTSIQKNESVDDSDSDGKTFALSARQVKIASKGFLDFDSPSKAVEKKPPIKPAPTAAVEDEWTKRLRYLAENGTSSLKPGEAFMFSEDTGEAVLFTNQGQRIRRVIAQARETQEVLKLRRPDVLVPKELFYNTALLGKVVNSMPPQMAPHVRPPDTPTSNQLQDEHDGFGLDKWNESRGPSGRNGLQPNSSEPPGFKIEQMMDNPTGFWNWFKGLVNL